MTNSRWFAVRSCAWCSRDFTVTKSQEKRKRFCGTSCSAKWRMRQPEVLAKVHSPEVAAARGRKKAAWFAANGPVAQKERARFGAIRPMNNPEVRALVSRKLREMGHKPRLRGGNGRGPTVPQLALASALGSGWLMEFVISTGKRAPGMASCYKIDIANEGRKIAVEVDGCSHSSPKGRDRDARKDAFLRSIGWTVVRVRNADVMQSCARIAKDIASNSPESDS